MDNIKNSIIGGKRLCGKTTELIKKSNKDWLYIVCATHDQAEGIANVAKSMKLDIPYPITFSELPITQGSQIKGVLVEEFEKLLEYFIKRPVIAASTSLQMKEMDSLLKGDKS